MGCLGQGHHETRRAIATLGTIQFNHRGLSWVEFAFGLREALNGNDLTSVEGWQEEDTAIDDAPHRFIV